MIKFYFDESPMSAGHTKFELEILERVNNDEEIQRQAVEVSEQLKKEVLSLNVAEGYFGSALLGVLQKTPRYVYYKNVGEDFDIEIDLVSHTVSKAYHLG